LHLAQSDKGDHCGCGVGGAADELERTCVFGQGLPVPAELPHDDPKHVAALDLGPVILIGDRTDSRLRSIGRLRQTSLRCGYRSLECERRGFGGTVSDLAGQFQSSLQVDACLVQVSEQVARLAQTRARGPR
jgi:hypothetical protein